MVLEVVRGRREVERDGYVRLFCLYRFRYEIYRGLSNLDTQNSSPPQ